MYYKCMAISSNDPIIRRYKNYKLKVCKRKITNELHNIQYFLITYVLIYVINFFFLKLIRYI